MMDPEANAARGVREAVKGQSSAHGEEHTGAAAEVAEGNMAAADHA